MVRRKGASALLLPIVTDPLPFVGALAAWAEAREVDLPDLEVSRPSLEDIYLRLTQESR